MRPSNAIKNHVRRNRFRIETQDTSVRDLGRVSMDKNLENTLVHARFAFEQISPDADAHALKLGVS